MNTFNKSERLNSQREIERLFREGRGFVCFPFSVKWTPANSSLSLRDSKTLPPVQVLISVSKRRFKHAVDRNRAKRLMRECYRLNKQHLYDELISAGAPPLLLSLSYVDNELPEFHQLMTKVEKLVERLIKEVSHEKAAEDCQ